MPQQGTLEGIRSGERLRSDLVEQVQRLGERRRVLVDQLEGCERRLVDAVRTAQTIGGVGTVELARVVGVDRETIRRWLRRGD